jgi:catechol 2,3-dioxygenase-like lactoylglutathione lyase family enzyme
MSAAREPGPVKMHLSINVANLERSLAFYEAFFGALPHKVRPGYANFDLDEPPLKFAMNQHPIQPGIGSKCPVS